MRKTILWPLVRRLRRMATPRRLVVAGTWFSVMLLAAPVVSWIAESGHLAGRYGPEPTPSLVAEGSAVYARNCAACHGRSEAPPWWRPKLGGIRPPPAADDAPHAGTPDVYLVSMIRDGSAAVHGDPDRTRMPPFRDVLSNREVHAVAAYLKTRWPQEVAAMTASLSRTQ